MKKHHPTFNPPTPETLSELLEKTPPVSNLDLKRLAEAGEALDADPKWRAEYLKSLFIEQILAALEESGMSQSDLAKKWGKSRQYLSKLLREDKRVNFTVETMVELGLLVNRRIELQTLRQNEYAHVLHCSSGGKILEKPEENWDQKPDVSAQSSDFDDYRAAKVIKLSSSKSSNDTDLAA